MQLLCHHICSNHFKVHYLSSICAGPDHISFPHFSQRNKRVGLTYGVQEDRTPRKHAWQRSDEFLTQITQMWCGVRTVARSAWWEPCPRTTQTISRWTGPTGGLQQRLAIAGSILASGILEIKVSPQHYVACTTDNIVKTFVCPCGSYPVVVPQKYTHTRDMLMLFRSTQRVVCHSCKYVRLKHRVW